MKCRAFSRMATVMAVINISALLKVVLTRMFERQVREQRVARVCWLVEQSIWLLKWNGTNFLTLCWLGWLQLMTSRASLRMSLDFEMDRCFRFGLCRFEQIDHDQITYLGWFCSNRSPITVPLGGCINDGKGCNWRRQLVYMDILLVRPCILTNDFESRFSDAAAAVMVIAFSISLHCSWGKRYIPFWGNLLWFRANHGCQLPRRISWRHSGAIWPNFTAAFFLMLFIFLKAAQKHRPFLSHNAHAQCHVLVGV